MYALAMRHSQSILLFKTSHCDALCITKILKISKCHIIVLVKIYGCMITPSHVTCHNFL